MSDEMTPTRGRLREHVAEEIRVLLARKRISAAELARRTGLKQSTMSRRMTGETAFDMDDLELIAEALGVEVTDLLPKPIRSGQGGSADALENRSSPRLGRKGEVSPVARRASGPIGPKPKGSPRPQSVVPPTKRRPQPTGPGNRPMSR